MKLSTKIIYSILFILFISIQGFGQKELFDTLKINATTKIIGRYPQYDKDKTNEKYDFMIEDSTSIAQFIKNLKLGDEVFNSMETPNFMLSVVKNYKELGYWTINPTLKSAMTHDGHTYEFNLKQITELNKKFPFNYYYIRQVFNGKKEYENYLKKQKNNPNFLFDYAPQFRYEGSFEIEFKKSKKFSSPKAISDFLTPYIEKIVNDNEYYIDYSPDEGKNKNNNDQYTMTINGPKKLFKKLRIDNLKNENWHPTVKEGLFFYKK